jgi:hypothetical protein
VALKLKKNGGTGKENGGTRNPEPVEEQRRKPGKEKQRNQERPGSQGPIIYLM